jgi:prephenate dehydrogenase
MGQFFAPVFERAGYEVFSAGRHGPCEIHDLVQSCDLVVVSVPIRDTVQVIRGIAPLMRPHQTLCDLTSLKVAPVAAMLSSAAQVVGLHPMFGPTVPALAGQRIIATPARCAPDHLEHLLRIFRREGASITVTTPEEHDRMMAVVQGLTHFATLCMAETMRRGEVGVRSALTFMSPVYRIELDLMGRLLSQDPALYADILQMNPFVPEVLSVFRQAAADLERITSRGTGEQFEEFFADNRKAFSEYTAQAARESDAIIRFLVQQ